MRRTIKAGAAIAGLALVLSACSSGSTTTTTTTGAAGTQAGAGASSAPPAAAGSLLIWADERRAVPLTALANTWGKENGVAVTVTQVNFEGMKDTYVKQAPAGQGPDIMLGANDWAGELVASGLVAPVQLGSNTDNFEKVAIDAFTLDGNTYGVPIAIENIALFRNPDLAPEAPTSIENMAATGLALQTAGKTQFPIGVQVGAKGDAYHAYPFYSAAGAYFFGQDAAGAYDPAMLGVGDPASLEFAKRWGQLGAQGAIKSTFEGGNILDAFQTGKAPYFVTGPWNVPAIEESGVKFVVEPLPGWEGVAETPVPIVGSQGFYLNSKSTNQTVAQAFLNATMNTEFMDSMFKADPRPPAWKESATAAAADPVIKAFGEFGAGGFPNLPIPQIQPVYEELGLAQARILDGADPAATMEAARVAIEARNK